MKKTILIVVLAVTALAVVGVGAAFAQGRTPYAGHGPMMQGGGMGYLHTYMVAAFAEKLNLQVDDVDARLAAGESMYDIAVAAEIKAEDFATFMGEVRAQALDAAVADGTITQEQADWMQARGSEGGYGNGNCPMHNGQGQPLGRGAGMTLAPGASAGVNGNGRGMMGGGFGWQNQQQNP